MEIKVVMDSIFLCEIWGQRSVGRWHRCGTVATPWRHPGGTVASPLRHPGVTLASLLWHRCVTLASPLRHPGVILLPLRVLSLKFPKFDTVAHFSMFFFTFETVGKISDIIIVIGIRWQVPMITATFQIQLMRE